MAGPPSALHRINQTNSTAPSALHNPQVDDLASPRAVKTIIVNQIPPFIQTPPALSPQLDPGSLG